MQEKIKLDVGLHPTAAVMMFTLSKPGASPITFDLELAGARKLRDHVTRLVTAMEQRVQ
jgi:hypothetical protein